jgi:hypothetical protein
MLIEQQSKIPCARVGGTKKLRGGSQGCREEERRPQRSGATMLAHDSGGLEWCPLGRKLRELKKAGVSESQSLEELEK